jgi:hypothetical protein
VPAELLDQSMRADRRFEFDRRMSTVPIGRTGDCRGRGQRQRQHHKQCMTKEDRNTPQLIAARFAGRQWRWAPRIPSLSCEDRRGLSRRRVTGRLVADLGRNAASLSGRTGHGHHPLPSLGRPMARVWSTGSRVSGQHLKTAARRAAGDSCEESVNLDRCMVSRRAGALARLLRMPRQGPRAGPNRSISECRNETSASL